MASAIGECVVKATRKAGQGMPGQWLVKCRGEEVGLIEQWAGSGQPWMAYYPIGMLSRKVGSFSGAGARQRATNAVLQAAGLI